MPSNIILANLTPATVANESTPPRIWTKSEYRDGSRPIPGLFLESFDDKNTYLSENSLPSDLTANYWTHKNNGSLLFLTSALEISDDIEKVKDGEGKALVIWRESDNGVSNNFLTDGILSQYRDGSNPNLQPSDRLYVKFEILFQPSWTLEGNSKLFRIRSYDGSGNFYEFFEGGNSGPILLWNWGYSEFGVRNLLAFRGDPQETHYYMVTPSGFPKALVNGDLSLNFDGNIRDLNGDSVNDNVITLIDKTTGEVIEPGTIEHAQVFGDTWNTIEFFVKMNSAPGVADGVLKQRINGQLCFHNENIPWVETGGEEGKLWNTVDFGGNNLFKEYPAENEISEWCSIDNIEIRHGDDAEGII